jgi:transposase InsO family protein
MKVDPFIEAEKVAGRNVAKACHLLEVSKSAYYERRNGVPSEREVTDAALLEKIIAIFKESKGTYGAPRIHKELLHRHVACGKRRVTKLMRQAGLEGRCKKRWRRTTVPDPQAELARDLIQRHFGPSEEIDRRYVGDITYIATWEGWSYLATVIDLASRRVVGWALADHMRTELVEDALKAAFANRAPEDGVIFHSDRGCQYTSRDFAELARANGVVLSVSRKGECWDKALVSYCTSCRWSGQNSLIEPASHAFGQGRVAGRGRLEEPDVLVVGLVRDEQTGTVPGLDGRGAHAEERGDLGNGEQTSGTEPFEVAWQTIAAA